MTVQTLHLSGACVEFNCSFIKSHKKSGQASRTKER
jgi:hypothetical protein